MFYAFFFLLAIKVKILLLLCLTEADTLMKSSGFIELDRLTKLLSLKKDP